MIAIDATPLALGPRRGVANALLHLLQGLGQAPPHEQMILLSPAALPPDVPDLGGVLYPARGAVASARAFRRILPGLLAMTRADVLWSPWSAFPRTSVPVVSLVHELPFVRCGPIEGRWRTLLHRRWLARDVRRCAAIAVPSEATRVDLLALHPDAASRVHVVPNGFDPAPWEAAGRAAEPAGGIPLAVVVGDGAGAGGARKKGIDVARAAAARLQGRVRLEVVAGREDPGEVRRLVASARLLVHPARSEGFGYPPLEAMAAGVPVVASRAGAIPEEVGDAAVLVPPGDATALAEAILRVATDDALRADLVRRGRERARAFPPAATARRALAVLAAARGCA